MRYLSSIRATSFRWELISNSWTGAAAISISGVAAWAAPPHFPLAVHHRNHEKDHSHRHGLFVLGRKAMDASPMKLLLVRHGEAEWNHAGRYQGQTDLGLSPRGEAQVLSLANRFAASGIVTVVASPVLLASATARIVAHRLDLSCAADSRLMFVAYRRREGSPEAAGQRE